MPLNLPTPLIYLITDGRATNHTLEADIARLRLLVSAAIASGIRLVQIREKQLSARALSQLTRILADVTRGSGARLLVNDRADVARTGGADGVHLTARSLTATVVRAAFGPEFLIGVSTHDLAEALAAQGGGADFAVFGPVFETPSKAAYGAPVGLEALRAAAQRLAPFPLIALGGINPLNARQALDAGASGVAAIRALAEPEPLARAVRALGGGR